MGKYCTECGTELIEKELEREGLVPYCPSCKAHRFPGFNVAVSIIVMNPTEDKILLIQQYGSKDYILVAGYVNKGEDAEHTVARELQEETGLKARKIQFNRSHYFAPSNTLMLNFSCVTEDETLAELTDEVDYAKWFAIAEAKENIKPNSLAKRFLKEFLEKIEG